MVFMRSNKETSRVILNLLEIISSRQQDSNNWVKLRFVIDTYKEKYGLDITHSIGLLTDKGEMQDDEFGNSFILEADKFTDFRSGDVDDVVRIRRELRYVVEMLLFLYDRG